MDRLSAAPWLSLFQNTNLRAKYVFASINFTEIIVLCFQTEQNLSKSKRCARKPSNHGAFSHPLSFLLSQITPPSPPLDPNSGY